MRDLITGLLALSSAVKDIDGVYQVTLLPIEGKIQIGVKSNHRVLHERLLDVLRTSGLDYDLDFKLLSDTQTIIIHTL